jgi:hypothetical protein
MYEPDTLELARGPTAPSLAPQAAGLVAASDRRRPGGQQGGHQPVETTGPRGRRTGFTPSAAVGRPAPAGRRAARACARPMAAWPPSLWIPWSGLDPQTHRRGTACGVRRGLTTPPMSAVSSRPSAGAPTSRGAGLGNVTKPPLLSGARRRGQRSKGGARPRANHLFYRRMGILSPAERRAHVSADRPPPSYGNDTAATICRPSAPSRPRAHSTSRARAGPSTLTTGSPFWRIGSVTSQAAWSSSGMGRRFIGATPSRRSS